MKEISRLPQKKSLKRIVVKVGSACLQGERADLNLNNLREVINNCCRLRKQGIEVILVCSGAILMGRYASGLTSVSKEMAQLQALSSIGQPRLMEVLWKYFKSGGFYCAQVLLTHEDLRRRQRFLNVRNTIFKLLHLKVVPVVNENDSVSFEEITVGDNDQLAAMIAEMVEADCLVMLSKHDGLYSKDPVLPDSKKIRFVGFSDTLPGVSLKGKSQAGRGGMATKVQAVKKLTPLGIPVFLASFLKKDPVSRALKGEGTYFEPSADSPINKKQRWLLATAKSEGGIVIDDGAAKALKNNASLLPAGIVDVVGNFRRGDCIRILCRKKEIALGLSEFRSADLRGIAGRQTNEIEKILGSVPSKIAVHRNNLILR